jgi:hypothetical protein
VTIVQNEIENQQRDQNACLQQLRLYVMHADDLLRRAARSSLIPDHVPIYGREFGEPESKHRRACTLDHRRSEPCLAQHAPTLAPLQRLGRPARTDHEGKGANDAMFRDRI